MFFLFRDIEMSKHRDLITLFRQSSKTTAKVGNNRKLSLAMNSFFANKDEVFLEKKIPLNQIDSKGPYNLIMYVIYTIIVCALRS